jgi:23S rRNA G2445 N2-methylase RlmL
MAHGLESVVKDELRLLCGPGNVVIHRTTAASGTLMFDFHGDLRILLTLKTVLSIYLVRQFPVPSPRGLLGDINLHKIINDIKTIRGTAASGEYRSFFVSAAGAYSPIMMRLKNAIASETGLEVGKENGDLQIRIRPCARPGSGWETLIRISPRPLATRSWRVCHIQGGLDAPVAHAMALMTRPKPTDTFLNLCCGSGTILIERLSLMPAASVLGFDISPEALACARQNVDKSGFGKSITLVDCDVREMPVPDASVDAICADLPFGTKVGSHGGNKKLYGPLLAEAARVAKHDARFCLLTGEIKLMQECIEQSAEWVLEHHARVQIAGLVPGIFLLRRSAQN